MNLRNLLKLAGRLFFSAFLGLFWLIALGAYVEFSLLPAILYVLLILALFLVVHVWFRRPRWSSARLQFPTVNSWKLLPIGLLAILVLTLGNIAWFLAAGDLPEGEIEPGTEFYLLPGLAIVAFPLIEEIVFRGWMQKPLEDQFHPVAAILIVAAIFAGFHSSGSFEMRLISGCFYGAAAWATGSVWIAVALHAFSNLIVLIFDKISEIPAGEQWLRATSEAGPMWLDVTAIALMVIGTAGAAFWVWRAWQRSGKTKNHS